MPIPRDRDTEQDDHFGSMPVACATELDTVVASITSTILATHSFIDIPTGTYTVTNRPEAAAFYHALRRPEHQHERQPCESSTPDRWSTSGA